MEPKERIGQGSDPAARLLQQMEAAFAAHDWPDVIRKANYLIKRMPDSISSTVYRWQGLALLEEGDVPQAQEALETALALVSDRELRLAPRDPAWLATQQQAQNQLAQPEPRASSPRKQEQAKEKETSPVPSKTKEQWLEEGNTLLNLKRYEDALSAYEQAIRLDPNLAVAYRNKGGTLERLGKKQEAQQARNRARQLGYTG